MKPRSLKAIASILGASTDSVNSVCGVAVDSRLLQPGHLFFALPGEQVDGHSFLEAASKTGAAGAVVKRDYAGPDFGLPLLLVENVLLALQNYAQFVLKSGKASIVAVTGSVGKTTTKEFISTLLRAKFKVSSSPGNSNSQIGLPLAIINHTSLDDEVIVLEMGMTQPGQISRLIEIAPPEVAVVTSVALVHAENFDSLAAIAAAKAEIFGHPETKLGIYHLESDESRVLRNAGQCKKKSFSTQSMQSDFSLEVVGEVLMITEAGCQPVEFPMLDVPGVHNLQNFLAAVSVARHFGLSWDEIKSTQSALVLPELRLQMIEKHGILFINDAYNASEKSMKAALDSLPHPKPGGRKIACFGGMVELGKFSEGCHQAVGKYALDRVDRMFCFGTDCLPIFEEWKAAGKPVVWTSNREELTIALSREVKAGDVVLLKGSRAKSMWKVLECFE